MKRLLQIQATLQEKEDVLQDAEKRAQEVDFFTIIY